MSDHQKTSGSSLITVPQNPICGGEQGVPRTNYCYMTPVLTELLVPSVDLDLKTHFTN